MLRVFSGFKGWGWGQGLSLTFGSIVCHVSWVWVFEVEGNPFEGPNVFEFEEEHV